MVQHDLMVISTAGEYKEQSTALNAVSKAITVD